MDPSILTVVESAPQLLTSLANVKAELSITDTSSDALLDPLHQRRFRRGVGLLPANVLPADLRGGDPGVAVRRLGVAGEPALFPDAEGAPARQRHPDHPRRRHRRRRAAGRGDRFRGRLRGRPGLPAVERPAHALVLPHGRYHLCRRLRPRGGFGRPDRASRRGRAGGDPAREGRLVLAGCAIRGSRARTPRASTAPPGRPETRSCRRACARFSIPTSRHDSGDPSTSSG